MCLHYIYMLYILGSTNYDHVYFLSMAMKLLQKHTSSLVEPLVAKIHCHLYILPFELNTA